jgi:DNA primase
MLDPIEEIKRRLDVVEVVSSYIKLQKAGVNYKALCPFHKEKTPSFIVSPSKQIWHCFGCDEGGDIFKFVMKIEGLTFPEALKLLAEKAGVTLKPQDRRVQSKRIKLYNFYERACDYFQRCLQVYEPAKEYLKKRGLKKKTIEEFRLGYAPERTKTLPMFKDRVIFPISDSQARVVAFTARTLKQDDKVAKYINSPDSLIYKKSLILYGFDRAKEEIKKKDFAVLVEGNMDLILSHQAGIKNVVASSGSALSKEQLRLLKRLSNNLYLCFDMDEAGQRATQRTIDLAIEEEMNIKVITLGEKDPADLILKNSKEWKKAIKQAKPIMDYYFDWAFSKYDVSKLEDKKEIAKILLSKIASIPNRIEQAHWIQKLAQRLGVEEKVLSEQISKAKSNASLGQKPSFFDQKFEEMEKEKKSRIEQLRERTAGLIFKYGFKKKPKFLKDYQDKKDILVLKIEQEKIENPKKEILICLCDLEILKLKQELKEISLRIKQAEAGKELKEVKKLTKKFSKLCQEVEKQEKEKLLLKR